jgi:WD40 repeat protein
MKPTPFRKLMTISEDGMCKTYDLDVSFEGRLSLEVGSLHGKNKTTALHIEQSHLIASGCQDHSIRIWPTEPFAMNAGGKKLKKLPPYQYFDAHCGPISGLQWINGGNLLLSISENADGILLWECLKEGKRMEEPDVSQINEVAMETDQKQVRLQDSDVRADIFYDAEDKESPLAK